MDESRFDSLARRLATKRSRRTFLAALVGGVAGAIARAGAAIPEAAALPCCGVCPPPCSCVCNGPDDTSCECPTCEPISCDGLCGVVDDGCGGAIDCGCCPNNMDSCESRCGIIPDGCGGTLDCGCCPLPGCREGQCGLIDDGCGGTLDCGCCPTGCEGRCGLVEDGCDVTIDRGGCPAGKSCAGGQCVVNDSSGEPGGGSDGGSSGGASGTNPDPATDDDQSPATDAVSNPGAGRRYVVLLDGFGSSSLLDDLTGKGDHDNHGVRDRFAPIVERLRDADPDAQFVYFSYRAGPLLSDGNEPRKGWTGQQFGAGREPVYRTSNVTDVSLLDHVKGLDWIVATLREQSPAATVDLVGFGLGGVVALAWVADRMKASDEAQVKRLDAVRRVVVVNSPIAGLNPRAVAAPAAIEELMAYKFDTGTGALVSDLLATGEIIASLPDAAEQVDAVSIEAREDFVVNGERIFDTGIWLGKGTAEILPDERRYDTRLGTIAGDVLSTHRLMLESTSDAAMRARDHLVDLLA
ncbi:MAG: hypothetical protein ACRDJH_21710 [Thermomicrobiales bacterium]